jgi:hypothetical protein
MTKLIEKCDVRIQGASSQAGIDSSILSISQGAYERTTRPSRGESGLVMKEVTEAYAVHLTPCRPQRAMIALVMHGANTAPDMRLVWPPPKGKPTRRV